MYIYVYNFALFSQYFAPDATRKEMMSTDS